MSVGLHIHVKELREIEKTAKKIGVKFSSHDYLTLIGDHLLEWVDKNFETEGKAPGRLLKWRPLKPSTVAGRRKGSKKILQNTGRLKQSFVSKVHRSAQWVAIGTRDRRAVWHQYGTAPYPIVPRRKSMLKFPVPVSKHWPTGFAYVRKVWHPGLPARPMLPTDRLGSKMAMEVLEGYVKHVLKDLE